MIRKSLAVASSRVGKFLCWYLHFVFMQQAHDPFLVAFRTCIPHQPLFSSRNWTTPNDRLWMLSAVRVRSLHPCWPLLSATIRLPPHDPYEMLLTAQSRILRLQHWQWPHFPPITGLHCLFSSILLSLASAWQICFWLSRASCSCICWCTTGGAGKAAPRKAAPGKEEPGEAAPGEAEPGKAEPEK